MIFDISWATGVIIGQSRKEMTFFNGVLRGGEEVHRYLQQPARHCPHQGRGWLDHLKIDIMKNQIPLPDMTWSVKDINTFIQHQLIHSLMTYDTQYNNREIEYIEHNYSSDASSL